VNKVYAWTHADLEDYPLSQGDEPLANSPDGFRIAQLVYEVGIDMISIEVQCHPPGLITRNAQGYVKVPRNSTAMKKVAGNTAGDGVPLLLQNPDYTHLPITFI